MKMGAGGSTGGKKGELLETMADHEESINCMCLSVSFIRANILICIEHNTGGRLDAGDRQRGCNGKVVGDQD